MYNLIEYSDHYLKPSGSLFQCYRDEPALNNDGTVAGCANNTTNDSFKFK